MIDDIAEYSITLRDARIYRGYSVKEIALVCGITVADYLLYENDSRALPFDIARKIKRLLQIKLEHIYIGLELDYKKSPLKTCLKHAQRA